ncbi:hypothetical protein MKW94_023354 [Papaver nudicaule]|uniref:At3g05675-like ankyrin-like domain-containing protein n=1 Tax=Papaver nudicaule TaxID=74823 RepID=A0AA41S0E3_PAPNU|nr:hypothetical protein [Papaver nudicaule]
MVLKLIRDHDSLRSNVICNKNILSSCESCLNSLLNLCEIAAKNYVNRKNEIALEVDNLLWLVDILVDWQAGEEFARMWANQQVLANLLMKYWYRIEFENSCHSINCITARLLVNIGNGKILPEKNTRQLLLKTWFRPLANDYSYLRKVKSFDQKVVEENIERMILELTPEDQQSILLAWLEYFMKNGIDCPDLRKGFEAGAEETPPNLSLPLK